MTLLNLKVFKTLNMWQITSIIIFVYTYQLFISYGLGLSINGVESMPCFNQFFQTLSFLTESSFPFKLHVVGFGLIPDREAAKFMKHQNTHSNR